MIRRAQIEVWLRSRNGGVGGVRQAQLGCQPILSVATGCINTTQIERGAWQFVVVAIIAGYNTTPRKCLGFKTPAEVFMQKLKTLHFNRDSTPQLPLG